VVIKVVKPKRVRKIKEWVEVTENLDGVKLTEPEQMFVNICLFRCPAIHSRLMRSTLPYRGTNYLSDFVVFEKEHPFWEGVVIEIQGGIFSRHKSGHSSSSGLIRDYSKATTAQRNRWFILQIAPDLPSIEHGVETLRQIFADWEDETHENDERLTEFITGGHI
jgi:hypothetical protein